MLFERIEQDFIAAMKAKAAVKLSTLRMLRSDVKNMLIEIKKEKLDDPGMIKILQKQVKQRKESIDQFKKGDREDLAEKEQVELAILEEYLPKMLSEVELKKIVAEAIKETGAETKRDMGKVMKVVLEKAKGRADGKTVSVIVSRMLK